METLEKTKPRTPIHLQAVALLPDGRASDESKEYEYASHARAYARKFLACIHELSGVGDVTIWFGEVDEIEVPELDDEYRAITRGV